MASVLIAVPTFESVSPDTFKALWDMDKEGHECAFEFVRGYDCATARNRIAQLAIDGGYDYVLMVDSDVVPPRDALANLLSHGVGFVSGYYLRRNAENRPTERTCVYRLNDGNGTAYYDYLEESGYRADELHAMCEERVDLVEVHGGGMGCALVARHVFERLGYPWFDWVNYKGRGMLSEDLYFCEKLRKARIPRYVDTRVSCGHVFRSVERA